MIMTKDINITVQYLFRPPTTGHCLVRQSNISTSPPAESTGQIVNLLSHHLSRILRRGSSHGGGPAELILAS